MAVQNGGDAMNGWFPMSQGLLRGEDLEKRKTELLAYCKLDTLAMFRIYEELLVAVESDRSHETKSASLICDFRKGEFLKKSAFLLTLQGMNA